MGAVTLITPALRKEAYLCPEPTLPLSQGIFA